MKVLAISGSLRDESFNTKLLRAAAELAPPGVEVELWNGLKAVPPFDEDDEGEQAPAGVVELYDALAGADVLLFATPEYNSSIPGQLKNAIDWASRPKATAPIRNKPAAVIGASTGVFGAAWAQAELRKVLASAGARVVDGELPVALAHTRFDAEGRLRDDEARDRLGEIVEALVAVVQRVPVAA
jgi:chromate reductase, NAD(P)H dehydrogenase (quinone)